MMFGSFVQSRFMPCPDCGSSVERAHAAAHRCDPERRLDDEVFALRHELAAVESEIAAYLASPQGRFELWYAARERRHRPS
jgi:hypothetical protein